ncbi:hypothetical protein ceV_378 [Chrysochromulina ericina virus CeV-01B]|jgi:hypothetical protein|uniref:Uncharacterized protein n=1 Tax=Chrysochromulina ericina virus CeV-01B TaxID=3070830 RepID=A0A0N9QJC8_9VIRU|nr:hypothetical protein ceV_378 [Chrysochromulina ericina virus]ALH23284.1 hypothetical protein ceV_378 [Chrysochromulina ericina virus CeV-01B]
MDEEYINKITLEYLLNPNMLLKKNQTILDCNLDKDIKFYRKRINQMTKDMIKGNFPNSDLKMIFENYTSELIYYFKQQDTKDIYQEEYQDLSLNKIKDDNSLANNIEIESIDNILLSGKNNPVPSLEKFVKKISITPDNHIIPQKKNINIKDPKLRVKGVKSNTNKE